MTNWVRVSAHTRRTGIRRRVSPAGENEKPEQARSDLDDYIAHVQEQVRTRGHASVRAHADGFRALGSTAAVNARDNTGTTGSGGVPIYRLNRPKVADDYGEFCDGTRSSKSTGRGVAGDLISGSGASGRQLLCTGTADDGATTNLPLGGGDPDGDGTSECTAASIAITANTPSGDVLVVSGRARYLALLGAFRVGGPVITTIDQVSITSSTGGAGDYKTGDEIQITVTYSAAVTITGTPRMVFRVDRINAKGELREGKRSADYVAGASTSTELAFAYTVRSVDFDKDGIRVKADSLELNGGTIKNTAGDADLSHAAISVRSGHKIHKHPQALSAQVVSSPNVGSSNSTGETITIEVAVNRNVRAITKNGTPTFIM